MTLKRKAELKRLRREVQEKVLKFAILHGDEYKRIRGSVVNGTGYEFISDNAVGVLMGGKYSSSMWGRIINAIRTIEEAKDDPDADAN